MEMNRENQPRGVRVDTKGFKVEDGGLKPMVEKDAENVTAASVDFRTARVIDEALNREPNTALDKEIAAQKMEEGARLALERGGQKYEAIVLEAGDDGVNEVAYKVENEGVPELVVEKMEAKAETAVETAGIDALNTSLEMMEEESESAFEKGVKSKWSMAGAGGRLMSAIKGSEAASFAYDLKDMFVGKKAEAVDLGDGETEQVIGTKGVFGTGLEAMWGAPKDMVRALGAAAAEVGNAAESEAGRMELEETAKFAKEMAAFENVAEKRGFLSRGAEALASAVKSPFDIVKNIGRHVQGEMIYPVIKGNMDMLKFIQEKITEAAPENPPVDLSEQYGDIMDIESSLGDDWDDLQAELADEEEKLVSVVTDRRLDKLKVELGKKLVEKEKLKLGAAGVMGTLEKLNALTKGIESLGTKISMETADREALKDALKEIQDRENDITVLNEVKKNIAVGAK